MTIGAAASKSTPFTIDTVEYYNRIIGFPAAADYTPPRVAGQLGSLHQSEHHVDDGDR